ncbi:hypothetical protein ACVWWO_003924 [Bradyrhizobium sp. F1.13.1]
MLYNEFRGSQYGWQRGSRCIVRKWDDSPGAEPVPECPMRKIGMNITDADAIRPLRRLGSALGLRHKIDTHGVENLYHSAEFGFGLAAKRAIQVLTG